MEQTGTKNGHCDVVTFLKSKRRSENYALFLETFDVGSIPHHSKEGPEVADCLLLVNWIASSVISSCGPSEFKYFFFVLQIGSESTF